MADQPEQDTPHGRLIEHEYDGIQEYDNPMPRWWLLTFAGTIVFSVIYLLQRRARWATARDASPTTRRRSRPPRRARRQAPGGVDPAQLLALASDRGARRGGRRRSSRRYCASCHGPDGGGVIGPNLTDDAWMHGGTPEAIYTTIAEGVLAKGMPPWEQVAQARSR